MRHILCLLLLCLPLMAGAQSKNKKTNTRRPATESNEVKKLRNEKRSVQSALKKKEQQLTDTRQQVTTKQQQVDYIEQQLRERVAYIRNLEIRIDSIDRATVQLEHELEVAAKQLAEKKRRYANSLVYARTQRIEGGVMWFVLSASTFQTMFRRARYASEYALHQHSLGKKIIEQQNAMHEKQNKLLAAKSEMNSLLSEITRQRGILQAQHREQQRLLGGLREQQKGLTAEIEAQRRRLTELDKKIDEVIAREIEAARKRAEEAERRRKRAEEAEQRRLAAAGKKTGGTSSKGGSNTAGSKTSGKPSEGAFVTTADRALSGSFEQNKGRLPVPITGSYRIGGRMGTYDVEGTRGVKLENKGVNYIGKPGAYARAIFDGEVTAVFAYSGTTNVLVRHGSYISVYCNLSNVRVYQGQKVKARELLGTVGPGEQGEPVLIFQLRREKAKLNPEQWISR